ncbi:hypothetical protein ACWGJX_46640 [Streptomyces sp. NPDC054775]
MREYLAVNVENLDRMASAFLAASNGAKGIGSSIERPHSGVSPLGTGSAAETASAAYSETRARLSEACIHLAGLSSRAHDMLRASAQRYQQIEDNNGYLALSLSSRN